MDDDRLSITSQLRKTKSMDASCLDIRSIGDASSPMLSLARAKSEYNLTASSPSLQGNLQTAFQVSLLGLKILLLFLWRSR